MEIRPIEDLHNTNQISELCHKRNEPIFITKNGYGDMVVMSIETFNRMNTMNGLYQRLAQAEQEIQEGKVLDGPTALNALREKYVLMTMDAYEEQKARLSLYGKLEQAEAQLQNGARPLTHGDVFGGLKEKYERK